MSDERDVQEEADAPRTTWCSKWGGRIAAIAGAGGIFLARSFIADKFGKYLLLSPEAMGYLSFLAPNDPDGNYLAWYQTEYQKEYAEDSYLYNDLPYTTKLWDSLPLLGPALAGAATAMVLGIARFCCHPNKSEEPSQLVLIGDSSHDAGMHLHDE